MSRLTDQPPTALLPLVGAVVFLVLAVVAAATGELGFAFFGPLATALLLVLLSHQGRRVNRERAAQQPAPRRPRR